MPSQHQPSDSPAPHAALGPDCDRLSVALRLSRDAFLTLDCDGKILSLNKAAEHLLGRGPDQLLGKPFSEICQLLDPSTRQPSQAAQEKLIQTGMPGELATPRLLVAADQSECLVEISAAPLLQPGNRYCGTLVVLHNVADRENAAESRRKARTFEALAHAASGIAHDFNNFLTAILGNLSLALTSRGLAPQLTERLTSAKLAGLRAQELSQQLHTFAKAGSPAKEIQPIGELLQESIGFGLGHTALHSEFAFDEGLWKADIDGGQVGQALHNLALFFLRSKPEGGTLQVSCHNLSTDTDHCALGLRAGPYLKILLHHSTVQIPKEHLKSLFDPRSKQFTASIGLAASSSIIHGHGGTIRATSRADEGTSFEVYLPAAQIVAPCANIISLSDPSPKLSAGPNRILILDDEEMLRELLSCALEMLGFEVTETSDGTAAIAAYQQAIQENRRFDLLIADLTIPGGMGGAETVRRIREFDPSLKAMVCSGYSTDPIVTHFREHGFCGILPKPYEIGDLGQILAQALASAPPPPKVVSLDFAPKAAEGA